jgi:hypothetical protein
VGVNQNLGGGSSVSVDEVTFEIFRYIDGSNPSDPASTPAIQQFSLNSPGVCAQQTCVLPGNTSSYCVLWDGSSNVQGEPAKINGNYGFRVSVKTNQQGASGNIVITNTRVYGGTTLDADGFAVAVKPILVDVNDVHVTNSTPTTVGQITGVSVQPYNLSYRLSKDATMYLNINSSIFPYSTVRHLVPGLPRTGEGRLTTPNATVIVNNDAWDGRDDAGNILPAANYLAVFQSNSFDQYTLSNPALPDGHGDLSASTTRQIALDPLQITDFRVQALTGGSTSLAVVSYLLTEPATVYMDIYPPGTQFCKLRISACRH